MVPIDEKKADFIRRYLSEIVLAGLCAAVVFLFGRYESINNFLRTEYSRMQEKATTVIERNTVVLEKILNENKK